MKKKFVVSILIMILLLTLACTKEQDEAEGRFENNFLKALSLKGELDATGTLEVEETWSGSVPVVVPQEPEATPQLEDNPVVPQSSVYATKAESVNEGRHEYSVKATDFNCGCHVDGNISPLIEFKENQVIFSDIVYDKIDANTYKRSYTGSYILSFPDEPGRADETVEEQRATVIIFNNNGYVMENYQDNSSSPCCYFTNTLIK
ncbi:MAG: hypothetical protein CVU42_15180 [Chloroflexi bacterium HGW-Chloroflexi-4]|nr:MAG: hypothetical protein CVU42_15180 [Chloroflexi bacterium HGW-Chloroflexi-4]